MAIKQRETTLDSILLKVVYPLLFNSSFGRHLLRRQLWHEDMNSAPDSTNLIELAPRLRERTALRSPSTKSLTETRAA